MCIYIKLYVLRVSYGSSNLYVKLNLKLRVCARARARISYMKKKFFSSSTIAIDLSHFFHWILHFDC